jgi:hypothetical protein
LNRSGIVNRKWKWIVLAVLLLLVGVYYLGGRTDAKVAEAVELHQKLVNGGTGSPELRAEYNRVVGDLNPQQLQDFQKENVRRKTEEYKRFFALPPEQQQAELDAKLDVAESLGRQQAKKKAKSNPVSNRNRAPVGAGGDAGSGEMQPGSPEHDQHARQFLDGVSAEDRALAVRYREAMLKRHLERYHSSRR